MATPRPKTLLLTGFEPFGGDPVNPSWEVAQRLHGQMLTAADGRSVRVVAVQLPCVFHRALDVLGAALASHRPSLVVALGLAANRREISLERVAVNVDDARIPDNAGSQPIDQPVLDGGPAAYFSTLPIKAVVAALQGAGLPAVVSQTAGTFVCNHVFYGLMHRLQRQRRPPHRPPVRGGFVHLPALPGQVSAQGLPGLALDEQLRAVRLALQVMLDTGDDLKATGGTVA
jgi:pyroglutamyl-peptidase